MNAFVTGASGFIGGALTRRLVAEGSTVHALARSDRSAAAVEAHGAVAVHGDLDDLASMRRGAEGCDVAFHCAAHLGEWGTEEEFERGNVTGTKHALAAAHEAGVTRFVHVGTEAALLAGDPLIEVDERAPLRFDSPALYSRTKARAEEAVVSANKPGFATVVVRPRLVWGPGDTTVRPALAEAVVRAVRLDRRRQAPDVDDPRRQRGRGAAARRVQGRARRCLLRDDGEPVVFREFVTQLLATAGVTPGNRSLPAPLARFVAGAGERAWGLLPLPGRPPLTRLAYWLSALETTIDITRARAELGYEPVITIEKGMQEL